MLIRRIEGANRDLGAPAGWDEARDGLCGVLPVLVFQAERGGGVAMASAWEPTPNELHALNLGGAVVLTIMGAQHPVVSLGVSKPHDPPAGLQHGQQLYDAYYAADGALERPMLGEACPFERLQPEHQAFWHNAAGVFLQLVRETMG